MAQDKTAQPRCVALVGSYLAGKTTLMESLLNRAGALSRKGSVREGTTVGDNAPEARARQMSTEISIASCAYLGDPWTVLDCPGSVELRQDTVNALYACDIAVVVCEGDPDKAVTVGPLLKHLDDLDVPHILFINKMDQPGGRVKATLEALQEHSRRPLVLREIPIRGDDGNVTGHVDLVSERAFAWKDHAQSEIIEIPQGALEREMREREDMLETLADFDDTLLEELLEDVKPSAEEVYDNLKRDLGSDAIVEVFFGSAEHDNGINRLWKALRHEGPQVGETAPRLGAGDDALALRVFKVEHESHIGKLALARVLSGTLVDGQALGANKLSGLYAFALGEHKKTKQAAAGDVVALHVNEASPLHALKAGDLWRDEGRAEDAPRPAVLAPLYAQALTLASHADEVKLTEALEKLTGEDRALNLEHDPDTGEMVLWGQGEMHLRIALDRLTGRFGLELTAGPPSVPYRETIAKAVTHRARHKKQSGGHGEFGDVELAIKPLARGTGLAFDEAVHGGAVPRNYIPAVEAGVKEYMRKGPLGHPVVDVAVTLTDGQHHSVDSSDLAFKKAAQLALREAMPKAGPVLLEPICEVLVAVPNAYTSNAQRIVSSRRGQILGFQPREGWHGWDEVKAHLPMAEMMDLIIDLRSQTLGVGTFAFTHHHLQECPAKGQGR